MAESKLTQESGELALPWRDRGWPLTPPPAEPLAGLLRWPWEVDGLHEDLLSEDEGRLRRLSEGEEAASGLED